MRGESHCRGGVAPFLVVGMHGRWTSDDTGAGSTWFMVLAALLYAVSLPRRMDPCAANVSRSGQHGTRAV